MLESTDTQTAWVVASASQTTFNYNFKILTSSEIEWYVDGTLKTLTTDYTLTGVGDEDGGTAVFVTPMTGGEIVWGRRKPPLTQTADYPEDGDFPASSHELALDKLTMQVQYLQEIVNRCIRWLPSTNLDTVTSSHLPAPGANSGKFLKLSASGITSAEIATDPIADPLGTKGDLLGHDGTDAQAISVGADNSILTALASNANGVQYQTLATLLDLIATTRGDILTVGASGIARYGKGTTSQHLSGDGTDTIWTQIPWAQGQCQLTLSGGNLLLLPKNGNIVILKTGSNWNVHQIANAGVSLSPSTFSPSTNYYIYLYNNSGTLTLEGSTTAPTRDTTTGFQVKTGDSLRLLVGFARCVTGPAWSDTSQLRFVRTWFNDLGFEGLGNFSADRTTTSATLVEMGSEIRCQFLSWGNEDIHMSATGSWSNSVNANCHLALAYLGSPTAYGDGDIYRKLNGTTTGQTSYHVQHIDNSFTAAYHQITLMASTSTGTLTMIGTTNDGAASLRIWCHGGPK